MIIYHLHCVVIFFLMLWNPEEKPVANAAHFLGWARQEPLRTLYQSLRQNLLTWEAQAVMLGRGVKRRSEFETSDFSQNPVWAFCFILGKTETIRLSCLYLYVPGPAELFLLLSLCTCCSFCWECPSHDWLSFLRLTHQLSEKSSLTTVLKGQPSTPELLVRFLLYFQCTLLYS